MGSSLSTTDQITNNINNTITSNISSNIQTAQNSVYQSQVVNINCDTDVIKIIENGISDCRTTLKNSGLTPDLINKYCKSVLNCKGSNINMTNTLNVTNLTNQSSAITRSVSDSIKNDITQSLTHVSNVLQQLFNTSDYQQQINNLASTVTKNVADIVQTVENSVTQNQTITLTNYSANNILMSSVSNIVLNSIQNNTSIQSSVQNISNQVTQVLNNQPKTLTDYISSIITIILFVVLLIFVIISMLKSESTRAVLSRYSPYMIFVGACILIIWLLKFLKPFYILQDQNATVKEIDNKKLLLYCSIYIIIFGVIEIIIFKYKAN